MSLFKVELLKLYKRKSVKVLLGIYGVIIFAMSMMYLVGEKSLGLTVYTEGQFLTASLSGVMAIILPFIALYISAASFGLELSKGTLKNMLLMPISKTEFYLTKIVAILSFMGLIISAQFAYSFIFGSIMDGGMALTVLGSALLQYLGAFLTLGVVVIAGALLSMITTSTGLAVLLGYLAYIGSGILSAYFPAYKTISLSHILSDYKFIFTSSNIIMLLSIISYYIIILMVGMILFDKKEEGACLYE